MGAQEAYPDFMILEEEIKEGDGKILTSSLALDNFWTLQGPAMNMTLKPELVLDGPD